MNEAFATAGLPPLPDPPQDRRGRKLPPATAGLLIWLQVLLVYARHLRDTLEHHAERGFARIPRYFGSAPAAFVLTNLTRGILRAIALEHVLLAEAGGQPAGGKPSKRTPPPAQPDAQQAARQQPAEPQPAGATADQLPGLPTLRQLEAAISRRPVESVIDDIGHDFGVAFSLCEARFGNALRDVIAAYRGTVSRFFQEFLRREAAVADQPESDFAFDVPAQKHDAIRIVGFLGAEPSCAFPFNLPPVAAAITGALPP